MLRARLTTVDNPHDPFDDYTAWHSYDVGHGYNSSALLARITQYSDDLSDADAELANIQAIDEIVRENVTGMFRKVERDVPDESIPLDA